MTDITWPLFAGFGCGFLAGWWACYFIITKPYKRIVEGQSKLINEAIDLNIKLLRMVERMSGHTSGDEWKGDDNE